MATIVHHTRATRDTTLAPGFLSDLATKYSKKLSANAELRNDRMLEMINSPAPLGKTMHSMAVITEKIPIFGLASEYSLSKKKRWLTILAGSAMNTEEININSWLSLLLSIIYALFPSVLNLENAHNRELVLIPFKHDGTLGERFRNILNGIDNSADAGVDVFSQSLKQINDLFPGQILPDGYLPAVSGSMGAHFVAKIDPLAWYGYLGAITFCITKNAIAGRSTAFEDNRFKAIRGKYGFSEGTAPILESGKGAPSSHALRSFHMAWRRIPAERSTYISYIVRSALGGAGDAEEAVYTTVRLMKWGDLTHFVLITQLLTLYPWVREIREWRGELLAYDTAVKQMYLMCPELKDANGLVVTDEVGRVRRDTTEMPFLKVKMGDTGDIGKANTMPMLTFVAKSALLEIQPSLRGYIIANEYPEEWDEFLRYKAAIETFHLVKKVEEKNEAGPSNVAK